MGANFYIIQHQISIYIFSKEINKIKSRKFTQEKQIFNEIIIVLFINEYVCVRVYFSQINQSEMVYLLESCDLICLFRSYG